LAAKQEQQKQRRQNDIDALLLSGDTYRKFIGSIPSKFTRGRYTRILRSYMHYYKCYPNSDLLVDGKRKDAKQIESEIISYLVKKRQPPSSLVYGTLNTIKSCLVTFYAVNDMTLKVKKIGRYLGEKQQACITIHCQNTKSMNIQAIMDHGKVWF
jgi:hypothetical protein